MKSFFVYILKCSDGSYYVGHTDDIDRRRDQHYSGGVGYVAKRLPAKLVFAEAYPDRDGAKEAERRFKGWSRKKKEALIEHGWEYMQGFWKRNE